MLTTSFGYSIRRNQHCINLRSHLGSAVSFVQSQLQKYNIRDMLWNSTWFELSSRLSPSPFSRVSSSLDVTGECETSAVAEIELLELAKKWFSALVSYSKVSTQTLLFSHEESAPQRKFYCSEFTWKSWSDAKRSGGQHVNAKAAATGLERPPSSTLLLWPSVLVGEVPSFEPDALGLKNSDAFSMQYRF